MPSVVRLGDMKPVDIEPEAEPTEKSAVIQAEPPVQRRRKKLAE
ncbi:MAG: hypothetical protein ACOYD1_07775 [Candidatus Nanopelagicales bacterium]